MTAARYRKKPVVIEAIQWTGDNADELREFTREKFLRDIVFDDFMVDLPGEDAPAREYAGAWHIETLAGKMKVRKGDYIVKGVAGEVYPVAPDIFERTYDAVEQSNGG